MDETHSVRQMADLKPGDHLCCIYGTEEEHRALIAPFLCQGLERGQKVLYIVDAHTAEEVLGYLEDEGIEVGPYLQSGQLLILTADDSYMREGAFDPDGMIRLLGEETEMALSQGYSALRVTGEMTWALKGLPGSERLIEYEAKLNRFFPGSACLAICQYDRRRFGPDILLDVLTTHPMAVIGTEIYDNFYYVAPEDYLGGKQPAVALEQRLSNLETRRAMENALRQERDFSSGLIQGLPTFFVAVDPDGRIRMVNQALLDKLGFTADEVLGLDYLARINEDDRRMFRGAFGPFAGGDEPPVTVGRLMAKDGEEIFVEWHARRVFKEDGSPDYIFGVGIDVTQQRKAEEYLKESRTRWERSFDAIGDAMLVIDGEMCVLQHNQGLCELLGKEGDYTGHKCYELIHGTKSPPDFCVCPDAIATKERVRKELYEPNLGRHLSASLSPLLDSDGDIEFAIHVIEDVTERKRTEEALRGYSCDLEKRVRELSCLYSVSDIVEELDIALEDILERMVNILPAAWQYPEIACARIVLDEKDYQSKGFKASDLKQSSDIMVHGKRAGIIEVYYLEERPDSDEGPFLKEERDLIDAVAERLGKAAERLSMEEALRESEEEYRLIVDNAQEGIWTIDTDANTTFVNQRMADMLGYTIEEMIGASLLAFMDDEGRSIAAEKMERRRRGVSERHDFEFVRKDGSRIYTSLETSPIYDTEDSFSGAVAFVADITGRRQAEDALRESEKKYRDIVDNAQEGIWTFDADANTTFVNQRMADMLGYTMEDMMGASLFAFMDEERKMITRENLKRRREGISETYELPFIRGDGSSIHTSISTSPVYGDDGAYIGALALVSDITERKKAEEEYKAVIQTAMDGFWITDKTGRLLAVNDAYCSLIGYSRDELLTMRISDFEAQMSPDEIERRIEEISHTGSARFETKHRRKDGGIVDIEVSTNFTAERSGRFFVFLHDITERKRAEDELRETRDYLDNLIRHANAPIIVWGPDMQIARFNDAFQFLTGYKAEEVMGRELVMLFPESSREESLVKINRALSGEYLESVEIPVLRKDGQVRIALWNSANIYSDDGATLMATIAQGQDITERKQAEEALAYEVEVDRAIAELSAALLTKASIGEVSGMVLDIARRLTSSSLGYMGYIDSGTGNLMYATLDQLSGAMMGNPKVVFRELEKMPVPAVENRRAFYSNSPSQDRRSFKGPLQGSSIARFIWVPSLMGETQVGQISLANSPLDYDEKDLDLLRRLADIYAFALLRMWSEEELEVYRVHLEELVKERTLDLDRINKQLQSEIRERQDQESVLQETASQLRALSARLQSIREEERRAIALDVHDKLGQALTGLKINVSLLKKKVAGVPELEEKIEGMSQLIDDTIETVREIAAQLRPGILDHFGLVAALDWQLQRFKEATGLKYVLTSNLGDEPLDKELSITLFRIAQEAMTNVARHAEAGRIEVHLFRDKEGLALEVADDGKGISEEQTSGTGSLGILGIKERAYALDGNVELKGEPGKGTVLVVRIPHSQVKMDTGEEQYGEGTDESIDRR